MPQSCRVGSLREQNWLCSLGGNDGSLLSPGDSTDTSLLCVFTYSAVAEMHMLCDGSWVAISNDQIGRKWNVNMNLICNYLAYP